VTEYSVITPVRNEAENLRRLEQSLASQTRRPRTWMIVDTGSDGETLSTIRDLEAAHDWIRSTESRSGPAPTRARAIVHAFNVGAAELESLPEIVVKLDADISMESHYFERLVAAFDANQRLGIASGTCYERVDGGWKQRHVTGDHVWGAVRAYRRSCLEQVSPLEERLGWDGIDEIKATLRGWQTRTLLDLPFYHHRREGEREVRAWRRVGETCHYLGYRIGYMLLRSLNQARRDPAALTMLGGYAAAALKRAERCPDDDVRSYVRTQQSLRQLPQRAREALGRRAAA